LAFGNTSGGSDIVMTNSGLTKSSIENAGIVEADTVKVDTIEPGIASLSDVVRVDANLNILEGATAGQGVIEFELCDGNIVATGTGKSLSLSASNNVEITAPAGQVNISSTDVANNTLTITPAGDSYGFEIGDIVGTSSLTNDAGTNNGTFSILTENTVSTATAEATASSTNASQAVLGVNATDGAGIGVSAGLTAETAPTGFAELRLNKTLAPPFSYSNSVVANTDGITHLTDVPGETTYTIQTNQDLTLNLTDTAKNVRLPNGNSIITTNLASTTTIAPNSVDTYFLTAGIGGGTGRVDTTVIGGSSKLFMEASNNSPADKNTLNIELSAIADAVIDHETVAGAIKNLTMRTEGTLNLTAGFGATGATPALPVQIASSGEGGALYPGLRMINTNTTGSCAIEIYKQKPTAGANGDVLHTQTVFGKDSTNQRQEYTRITHTIRDPANTAEDGSMELGCFVNGAYTNFIQLNANDAPVGEVNIFRPMDFLTLAGAADAGTIKVSGPGSVNLNLDASTSSGTGAIALKTRDGTAGSGDGLLLSGNTLLSATSSGNSGQHLCLTIGGVRYKIKLENP
jgi:hypothetical protein